MPNIGKRKKVMFLYNPSSGKGKVEKNIDMIVPNGNAVVASFQTLPLRHAP